MNLCLNRLFLCFCRERNERERRKKCLKKNQILRIELRTSNVNPIERNVHVALYISLSFPIWFRSDCIHIALSYSLYQMVDREPLLVEIVITARVSKHKNIVQSIFIVAFWRIGNKIMIIKTISNIWTVWVGQFRNDSIDCHHLNGNIPLPWMENRRKCNQSEIQITVWYYDRCHIPNMSITVQHHLINCKLKIILQDGKEAASMQPTALLTV